MSSAQHVWEFSRAFLSDRDGYVAVLNVFMDETGIHDDARMVAVGGYISRPKHWRAWTKDWNRAKRPIKVFHATDCANFRGEFEGWTKEQRDPYVANLLPVIPAHELAGIVIGVQLERRTFRLNRRDSGEGGFVIHFRKEVLRCRKPIRSISIS